MPAAKTRELAYSDLVSVYRAIIVNVLQNTV